MRPTRIALGVVALVALASLALAAEQGAPPAPPAVPMVELTFDDGAGVTGRLVKESDQTVQVTSFAGSTIGYARTHIESVRHFSLPAGAFAEQAGDYQTGQLWKAADGPGAYVKARDQYVQAMLLAATPEDRDRIEAKTALLEKERDALQAEAMRKAEAQKAADEADAARLQKQLTQQQIASLQALAPRMQQLEQGLRQTNQAIVATQNAATANGQYLSDLAAQLSAIRNELTTLEYNIIYVPYPVYNDRGRPRGDDSGRDGSRGDDDHDRGVPRP